MTEEKMKTYLITFQNGKEQKITVPETWKVTFGPAARGPNSGKTATNYKMPLALRFYEAKEKQRAIFTDVAGFRDMDIQIEEKKVRKQDKEGYVECDGVRKRTTFSAEVSEWINPDELKDMPALPMDETVDDVADAETF